MPSNVRISCRAAASAARPRLPRAGDFGPREPMAAPCLLHAQVMGLSERHGSGHRLTGLARTRSSRTQPASSHFPLGAGCTGRPTGPSRPGEPALEAGPVIGRTGTLHPAQVGGRTRPTDP
jgi:hypothetical protein